MRTISAVPCSWSSISFFPTAEQVKLGIFSKLDVLIIHTVDKYLGSWYVQTVDLLRCHSECDWLNVVNDLLQCVQYQMSRRGFKKMQSSVFRIHSAALYTLHNSMYQSRSFLIHVRQVFTDIGESLRVWLFTTPWGESISPRRRHVGELAPQPQYNGRSKRAPLYTLYHTVWFAILKY